MVVEVRGKNNLVITDALRTYASEKLEKVGHYFNQNLEAFVLCKTYNDHHKVEITVPTKYFTMRAEVAGEDMYAAIDLAIDKLERQIRKNKTKLERTVKKRAGISEFFSKELNVQELENELVQTPIKTKNIELERLTVSEAITQLEMVGHDFFIFIDEESKKVSVVYRRKDGDYAVIKTS